MHSEPFAVVTEPALREVFRDPFPSLDELLGLINDLVSVLFRTQPVKALIGGIEADCRVIIPVGHSEQGGERLVIYGLFIVATAKAAHGIGVGMDLALFIDKFEVVGVQFDGPPCTTAGRIFLVVDLLPSEERAVVGHRRELRVAQIMRVCSDGAKECEKLPIVSRPSALGRSQFFRSIANHFLFPVNPLGYTIPDGGK